MDTVTALTRLGTALAIGLMLGLEREHSTAGQPARPAGSRTFALIALAGAVAAVASLVVVAVGLAAVAALVFAWYWHDIHQTDDADVGATTEAAALLAYLLGATCWSYPQFAVPAAVAVTVLLAAKRPLHRLATRLISDRDVTDALTLFVVAFVVLPLLPDRPLGPYGALNPRRVWLLVVAVTLIGWAGYLGSRALGQRTGLLLTGLAGGFVSGSATTVVLARRSRDVGTAATLPAALATNVATLVLLVAITAVVNPAVSLRLSIASGAGVVVLTAEIGWLLLRGRRRRRQSAEDGATTSTDLTLRPMSLRAALMLALILVAMLMLTRAAAGLFGAKGVITAAAVGGLADAHSSSLAAVTLAGHSVTVGTALLAVGAALATNTLVKLTLAGTAGGLRFAGLLAAWLAVPAAAVTAGLLLATGLS